MIDQLEVGKLKKRVDTKMEDKLAQKRRLKSMLQADQITLRRLVFYFPPWVKMNLFTKNQLPTFSRT